MLKRNKQMLVRLTADEADSLRKKIIRSGLSQQNFFLKCCFEKRVFDFKEFHDLRIELKRIGNNLNQLTRLAHQSKNIEVAEVEKILKEVKELWRFLKRSKQGQGLQQQ